MRNPANAIIALLLLAPADAFAANTDPAASSVYAAPTVREFLIACKGDQGACPG